MIFEDVRSEAIKSRDKYFAACDTIISLNQMIDGLLI
jgi:hypothetical protein